MSTFARSLRLVALAAASVYLPGVSAAQAPPSTGMLVTDQIELARLVDLCASRLGLFIGSSGISGD